MCTIFKSLRVLCLAGIFLSCQVIAQHRIAEPARIGLDVKYAGYLSNYEYFNPVVPGYTLFGHLLEPTLRLRADQRWSLFAGAWLQQDFGRSGFHRAAPHVRLQYRHRNAEFRFGNLDNGKQHELLPWLYDPDDFIARGPSYGAQFRSSGYRIKSDTWIAWRRMIDPESFGQEQIEAGTAMKLNLLDSVQVGRLYIPIQGVLQHRGGQIGNIDSAQKVFTLYGTSVGLGITRQFQTGLVKDIGAQAAVGRSNNEDIASLPAGKALSTNAFVALRNGLSLEASWWVGNNFYVPTGAPLYQSRSSVYAKDTAYFNQRQLLFLTMAWHWEPVPALDVDTWIQPYYDVNLALLEYGYRLRLTYRFEAGLLELKQVDMWDN